MGAVGCVDRKCCAGDRERDGPDGAQMLNGKTMWTLNGTETLPNGAACLYVPQSGIEPPIPLALQSMMEEPSRNDEFRTLCGRLLTFGPVSQLDLDEALVACAPGFARTDIDLYLSEKFEDGSSAGMWRWFIFVDRKENPTFIPMNSLKVKNSLGGGDACELVETNHGSMEPSVFGHGTVNFSGAWVEIATEGDMDAFLQDMGWTLMARTISNSINHGVRKQEQHIDHRDNWMSITQASPSLSSLKFTSAFTIGGGLQDTTNADGNKVQVKPNWVDGGKAIYTPHWDHYGDLMQVTKRYLRQDPRREMVTEMTSPGGVKVKRIWVPLDA